MTAVAASTGFMHRIFNLFDVSAVPPQATAEDPRIWHAERRRMIQEIDPQCCGSETGAQMLMSQFPGDF